MLKMRPRLPVPDGTLSLTLSNWEAVARIAGETRASGTASKAN
jgi:hypothetical protein